MSDKASAMSYLIPQTNVVIYNHAQNNRGDRRSDAGNSSSALVINPRPPYLNSIQIQINTRKIEFILLI